MKRIEISRLPKLGFVGNEAMNTLATNLSYCGDSIRTVLMTSRYAYEGKSFMTLNLMRTIASLQKKVVLLDTDLRCSRLISSYSMRFPEKEYTGLAQYLAGMCEIEDIIYETNVDGGFFVPVGRKVSNSLQLLSSARMAKLMEYLAERFDMVLVDTPPAGIIVDALEIAKYCDGAVIVVGYNRGHRQDVGEVSDAIRKTGCPVLGAVLNNVDFGALTSRKYYYKSEKYYSYYNKGGYNPYGAPLKKKEGFFAKMFRKKNENDAFKA